MKKKVYIVVYRESIDEMTYKPHYIAATEHKEEADFLAKQIRNPEIIEMELGKITGRELPGWEVFVKDGSDPCAYSIDERYCLDNISRIAKVYDNGLLVDVYAKDKDEAVKIARKLVDEYKKGEEAK